MPTTIPTSDQAREILAEATTLADCVEEFAAWVERGTFGYGSDDTETTVWLSVSTDNDCHTMSGYGTADTSGSVEIADILAEDAPDSQMDDADDFRDLARLIRSLADALLAAVERVEHLEHAAPTGTLADRIRTLADEVEQVETSGTPFATDPTMAAPVEVEPEETPSASPFDPPATVPTV